MLDWRRPRLEEEAKMCSVGQSIPALLCGSYLDGDLTGIWMLDFWCLSAIQTPLAIPEEAVQISIMGYHNVGILVIIGLVQ